MSDAPHDAKAIFFEALDQKSPEDLRRHLDAACEDDDELRSRVEDLLLAHREAGKFLGGCSLADPTIDMPPIAERPGSIIGPYKLLQKIGEGGMGVVYLAEQSKPVERRVALKIIKPGLDTRNVIARFEAERQALALMDHPNIARVLDAGATETGRPYFVMELVKGISITKYCDEQKLSPRDRLQLFVPICQAVQHAHQKGIIHRDLKPSNVLIARYDDRAVPKIIDFGVAKAISQRLTEKTVFTQHGQILGTIEYMSPEQATFNQLDVDTRSDVYSLGVLLYELLTGQTPIDRKRLRTAAFDEVLRVIRDEEPPKPSSRLSSSQTLPTLAANRHTDPKKLTLLVRGELDWIVMKALEKDRSRRYETANNFAADVQRYLDDDPVLACPPSATYRFRKFARRNRTKLAIFACFILAFVVLTGGIGWVIRDRNARQGQLIQQVDQALRDADHRQREGDWRAAKAAVERAQALIDSNGGGKSLSARVENRLADFEMVATTEDIRLSWGSAKTPAKLDDSAFDNALALPLRIFGDDEADAAYTVAFRGFGLDVDELDVSEAATRIRSGSIRGELVTALDHWALVRKSQEDALSSEHLLAIARAADDDDWRNQLRDVMAQTDLNKTALEELAHSVPINEVPPATIVGLAEVLESANMTDSAVDVLRRAQRKHPDDFWINARLGFYYNKIGQSDDAIRFLSIAIALRPHYPITYGRLGLVLNEKASFDRGRFNKEVVWDDALAACREAVRLDPKSAFLRACLATVLARAGDDHLVSTQGNADAAIAEYREAIRLDPDYLSAYSSMGYVLSAIGRLDEAEHAFREVIRRDHDSYYAHYRLGCVLFNQGHSNKAISMGKKAIRLNPNYMWSHSLLVDVLQKTGRWDESYVTLQAAIAINSRFPTLHYQLGRFFHHKGEVDEAMSEYQQVLKIGNLPSWHLCQTHFFLGQVLQNKGRLDEAIEHFQTAWRTRPEQSHALQHLVAALTEAKQPERVAQIYAEAESSFREAIRVDPENAAYHHRLGHALRKQERFPEAADAFREAIRLDPENAAHHHVLGDSLSPQGKFAEAEAAYREAIRLDPNNPGRQHNFGGILRAQGKHDQAADAFREAILLNPENAARHNVLGDSLSPQGKFAEAEVAYREAIRLDPNNAGRQHNFGDILRAQDKLDEAADAYREAIRIKPSVASYHHLAGVLVRKDELDQAVAAVREAIRLEPENAALHTFLSEILRRQNKIAEAEAEFLKAEELKRRRKLKPAVPLREASQSSKER